MIRCRDLGRFVVASIAVGLLMSGPLSAQPNSPPTIPPLTPPIPSVPSPPTIVEAPPQPVLPAPSAFVPTPPSTFAPASLPPAPQLRFTIDPKTPVKDLLPIAPKATAPRGPVLSDDLTKVPDADFQAMPADKSNHFKMTERTAHQFAKINHLNAKKTDGFMVELLESRPDLAGLPFAMGDDCRSSSDRLKMFTLAIGTVQQAMASSRNTPNQVVPAQFAQAGTVSPTVGTQPFWSVYPKLCENEDAQQPKADKDHVTIARIAALMQMLAVEPTDIRLGLVKYLTGVPHVEATRALARLAIFSVEDEVQAAAVDALKVRREKDYTDILLKGLRYPWPAVAKRSASAIARMERNDLLPELLTMLDEGDPRLPQLKREGWRGVTVVREVVKVNHLRNCAMCHTPVGSGVVPALLTVQVPIEGQAIGDGSNSGYGRSSTPELMIRVDVTYLRQDFSVLLAVGDAHPWPDMQRFDFLVRERKVTTEEAALYREKLTPKEEGVLSPYHKAALAALRQMTGKDTAPTAEAWRKLLGMTAGTP